MVSGRLSAQDGIAKEVKAWSSRQRHYHAECKIFVASHSRTSREYDKVPGQYDLSRDVIQCSTESTFSGQAASFMLIPRRRYQEMLYPGDHVSVYFATNVDAPVGFGVIGREDREDDVVRVFIGVIDSVTYANTIDPSTGRNSPRISVSCSGLQKVFDRSHVYFNQNLGPKSLFGSVIPGLADLMQGAGGGGIPLTGTATTLPRGIALAYMGFGGQFLLPDSYPSGVGTPEERKKRLKSSIQRAIAMEESLGFSGIRGVGKKPAKPGLIQLMAKRNIDNIYSNSILTLMDVFSYVEDAFVDGKVHRAPFHDMQGAVWNLMMENVNPMLNEMYISLLPPQAGEFSKTGRDEWGQSPHYVPALVIRERPFSWVDSVFRAPIKIHNTTADFHFGNLFFSDHTNPALVPKLQGFPGKPFDNKAAAARLKDDGEKELAAQEFLKILNASESAALLSQKFNISLVEANAIIDRVRRGEQELAAREFLKVLTDEGAALKLIVRFKINLVEANAIIDRVKRSSKSKQSKPSNPAGFSQGFRSVDRIKIQPEDVGTESIGLSDNDHFNFFMISSTSLALSTQQQKFVLLQDGLIPLYNEQSIKRYGLRVRELQTKFMHTGQGAIDKRSAMQFLIRSILLMDLWYQHAPWFRAGTITTRPIPKARIGMVLDIGGTRQESYYVERVAQAWSHGEGGGHLETSFTLTRGQPSEPKKRFGYAPPHPVQVFNPAFPFSGKLAGSPIPRAAAPTPPEQPPLPSQVLTKKVVTKKTNPSYAKDVDAIVGQTMLLNADLTDGYSTFLTAPQSINQTFPGAHFGALPFSHVSGVLDFLIDGMKRDSFIKEQIKIVFGSDADKLLGDVPLKTISDIDGLQFKFRALGALTKVQAEQRRLARFLFFDSAAKILQGLGFITGESHALLFDIGVELGLTNQARYARQAAKRSKTKSEGEFKLILTTIADDEHFQKQGKTPSKRRFNITSNAFNITKNDQPLNEYALSQDKVTTDSNAKDKKTKATTITLKKDRQNMGSPPWEEAIRQGAMWDHVAREKLDEKGLPRTAKIDIRGISKKGKP